MSSHLKQNPIKDFLFRRFAHPWMPMAFYLPIIFVICGLALFNHPRSVVATGLWFGLGMFSPWRDIASGLHLAHHRSAQTDDLILAPPISSLGFGSILYLLKHHFQDSAKSYGVTSPLWDWVFQTGSQKA